MSDHLLSKIKKKYLDQNILLDALIDELIFLEKDEQLISNNDHKVVLNQDRVIATQTFLHCFQDKIGTLWEIDTFKFDLVFSNGIEQVFLTKMSEEIDNSSSKSQILTLNYFQNV